MTVAVAVAVGFLATRLVWLLLRPVFGADVFARENYRGRLLPTSAGLGLAVAVVGVEAGRIVLAAALDDDSRIDGPRLGVLVLAVGLALLGLVDDLAGEYDRKGFRGHLESLVQGRLTTGGLKLFGGGAVAVVAAAAARPASDAGFLLADAALVALAANLGNLFDRAPGRTIKVAAVAYAALVAGMLADPRLAAVGVVIGGGLALLVDDLRERLMLGDTGANVLGGAIGLALVVAGSPVVRLAGLGVVLVLNGVSEWVSFSRVIDRVPPLRAIDRLGANKR